ELNDIERAHVDRSLAEAAGRVRAAEQAELAENAVLPPAPGRSPVLERSPVAGAAPGEIEMPPLLSIRLPQSPWAIRDSGASAPIPEPIHAPDKEAIPEVTAHQSRTESSGEAVAVPPVLGEQPPAQTSEPQAVAPPTSADARAPSTFQVRNMLGLSGNRGQAAAAVAAPSTPTPTPTPAPTDESRPSLLGLG